ncbi:MAG: TonB-dependent receptor plug domain-containing protein [Aquificaceae bacterium]
MKRLILATALLSSLVYAKEERLEDIVITATKQELELKQAPQQLQLIKREELKDMSRRDSLRDLLIFDSSLLTLRMRGRDFLGIRGFDSDKILIFIDGRRLTGEVDRDFEIDRITLDRVERVEILKGPGSVLYGSDALGGVINIITKEPLKPELSFSTRYGKYSSENKPEEKQLSFSAYSGRVGNFNVGVFGRLTTSGPYQLPQGTTLRDERDLKTFGASLFYYLDKDSKSKIRFDYDHLGHKDVGVTRFGPSLFKIINDNKRQNLSLALDLKRQDWNLFLRSYASLYDKDFERRRPTDNKLFSFDIADRNTYLLEGYFSKDVKEVHRLTVGGEGRREGFKGTRLGKGSFEGTITREGITQTIRKVEIDYYALYLQDEWFISDRAFLVAGLRYDDSDKFEGDLSPRIGLTYSLLPNLRLKANYAHGFKTPTPRDLYILFQTPTYAVVGNPNLKSEKTDGIDLGLEAELRDRAGLKASLFYTKAKDLIDTCQLKPTPDPGCPQVEVPPGLPPNVSTYRNVGEAKIWGVELSGAYKPVDWVSLKTSYTFLEARDEVLDQRLLQRPRHRLIAGVGLKPFKATKIDLLLEHTEDFLFTATQEKSFTLLNLFLSQKVYKGLELFGGVENLGNKKDMDLPILGSFYFAGLRGNF